MEVHTCVEGSSCVRAGVGSETPVAAQRRSRKIVMNVNKNVISSAGVLKSPTSAAKDDDEEFGGGMFGQYGAQGAAMLLMESSNVKGSIVRRW